jgi:hypothetical protein
MSCRAPLRHGERAGRTRIPSRLWSRGGRADPNSSDPQSPDPIGNLKSNFLVYIQVNTPFGVLSNQEPIEMRATIKSIPPDPGKYRQYSQARDLFDDKFKIAAQMQCAVHDVKLALDSSWKKGQQG